MAASTSQLAPSEPLVGMGQSALVARGQIARAVLGSCVGLVLLHPRRRCGTLAHVVLPAAAGRNGPPGKFADTVVPHLLELLLRAGVHRSGIVAKVTGGAAMFGSSGPIQVGQANLIAVKDALESYGLPVIAQHTGGTKGRRITFHPDSGIVTIEVAGEVSVQL